MGPYTELYLDKGQFFFAHPIEVGSRVFHMKRERHGIVTRRRTYPGTTPKRVIYTYEVTLTNGEIALSSHAQLLRSQVSLLDFLAEASA